jgi:hypothetical protein
MPKIGIIAEGETDQIVIENILIGLGVDAADVIPLRPKYRTDETDKGYQGGTWQGVKNDCLERIEFDRFFQIADDELIIIQLDTAECEETDFGVSRPMKENNANYASELRQNVIQKVNTWLDNHYENKLLYAITIEEMESWILTIYLNEDTNKGCRNKKDFFDKQTIDFRKKKNLNVFVARNKSLSDFAESVKAKLS